MFPHLSIDIKLFISFTFKQHVFFREIRKHHTIVYKIILNPGSVLEMRVLELEIL